MAGDALAAALARYFASPAVASWLGCAQPVSSVTAQALSNSLVYAITFGLKSRTQNSTPIRKRMDVEDMLCVCSVTSDNFALGMVYGLGQPHVFARTPLMHNVKPLSRRFAVDLNQTRCLEFMEFVHFQNGMVCCCFRQFLHTPDGSLPVVVHATLHSEGSNGGVFALGPVVMRSETFEAVTCPVCRRDNYACACPFEAKSRVLSGRVATRNWAHFTSKLLCKARYGKIRISVSAVVPALGEVPMLSRHVDSLNVIVQGQNEYMTLVRRKAVHSLGLVITHARTDMPLNFGSEAADYLALHSEHVRRSGGRYGAKRRFFADDIDPSLAARNLANELLQGMSASLVEATSSPLLANLDGWSTSMSSLEGGRDSMCSLAGTNNMAKDGSSQRRVLDAQCNESDALLPAPYGASGVYQSDSASCDLDQILLRVAVEQSGSVAQGLTACLPPNVRPATGMPGTESGLVSVTQVRDASVETFSRPPRNEQQTQYQGPQLEAPLHRETLNSTSNGALQAQQVAGDTERGPSNVASTMPTLDFASASTNSDAACSEDIGESGGYGWQSTSRSELVASVRDSTVQVGGNSGMGQQVQSRTLHEYQQQFLRLAGVESSAFSQPSTALAPSEAHGPQLVGRIGSGARPAETISAVKQQATTKRRRPSLAVPVQDGGASTAPEAAPEAAPPATTGLGNSDGDGGGGDGVPAVRVGAGGEKDLSAPGSANAGLDGERKHGCTRCPSRFKLRGDLQRHVKVVHEKKKTFVCATCGKAFGHSGHLNRHERSHRGERRFKCAQCGYDFHQRSHLVSHVEHIHSSSRNRQHECALCKLRVATVSELRRHLRTVHDLAGIAPADADAADAAGAADAGVTT